MHLISFSMLSTVTMDVNDDGSVWIQLPRVSE